MRPLNRPMFRYGGPIKQGIMSGIREPKRNGGRMLLVGQHPKQFRDASGREQHWAPLAVWGGNILRTLAWPFARKGIQQVAKKFAGPQRTWSIGKGFSSTPGYTQKVAENVWKPTKLGSWFAGGPEAGLARGIWAGKGYVGKPISYLAKSPITLGGLIWTGVSWLRKDGTPANEKEIAAAKASTGGPPGGGDPGMQGTGEWFAEQAEKEAKIAKQKEWANRIKKYRDIMDIKGMNKEAAYKSLVDASKLIQESQDFKGDIKSGKLINQVIQAASKQFDKPSKTSDAINTLILQNELKKDLNKEANALDKAYKQSAIAINEAKLAENTLAGDIRKYTSTNKTLPAGNTLAGFATGRGYPIKGVEDTTIVKNWMKENNGTEVDYLQNKITDIEVAPGLYVINDKILQIDENKKVTPVSTSSM